MDYPLGRRYRFTREELNLRGVNIAELRKLGFRSMSVRDADKKVVNGIGRNADWIPPEELTLAFPHEKKYRLTWEDIYGMLPIELRSVVSREKIDKKMIEKGFRRITIRRNGEIVHGFGRDPLPDDDVPDDVPEDDLW